MGNLGMRLTPAMRQFVEVKEQYPDAIILFRMGDFYECFYEDAKIVSSVLGITLTSRGKDEAKAPLAGIPYHALDKYLKQLVESGHKIAICDQIEDPKLAKGIVKRAVTRVITPGTVIEESVLQDKSNNYIVALFADGNAFGFACADISTGEFITTEFANCDALLTEIARFAPSEIIVATSFSNETIERYISQNKIFFHKVADYFFWITKASEVIKSHFGVADVGGFGFIDHELALCASGGLLSYLKETQKNSLSYINTIKKHQTTDYMVLDNTTIRNLELLRTVRDQQKSGSLLSVLDHTVTSMGARLLKNWLLHPLTDKNKIVERHAAVENLRLQPLILTDIRGLLSHVSDIERLLSRISYGAANARDVVSLKQSLSILPEISRMCETSSIDAPLIKKNIRFGDVMPIVEQIDKALKDECPVSIREGGFIKQGFFPALDELHAIATNGHAYLAKIEQEEIEKTGITSLKIRYNRVFGYYIEITNRFKEKVPAHYVRKQSTVNGERFVTEELAQLETKILGAQEKINEMEFSLFIQLCDHIKKHISLVQDTAQKVATLDCLACFAQVSQQNNYCVPQMVDGFDIVLENSRHPVIERLQSSFVPNDCSMSTTEHMMIITGPNMAGKSTYMRQVALCILLAHIGCFVPASSARISIIDRIFTRVGASDDLGKGQSTFMVEMTEAANILRNATKNSFIVLDEVGSGTSTYDGVSLAWAIASDLAKRVGAKTLFSTHYHVLTKLEQIPGVVNMHTAVLEANGEITFLRKIVRGGTDKSYGIHVAKLAGIPAHVIDHAHKIQLQLEEEDEMHDKIVVEKRPAPTSDTVLFSKLKQKTLFEP